MKNDRLSEVHPIAAKLSVPMRRIVIVGASGFIGGAILKVALHSYDVIGTSGSGSLGLVAFDLARPDDFDYDLLQKGDLVFITAAISSPDICSRELERAWAVNVSGTSIFIQRIIELGIRVIFFSSDAVYGEREDEFDEALTCNPMGEYSEMKHYVEKRFTDCTLFKAIRLSYVFSRDDKFSRYLNHCVERNEEADLFHPFFRSVVYLGDVVEGALALADRWDDVPEQFINFGGPHLLSRVDFAECLREVHLHNLHFKVSEPPADFFMNRPRVIAMKSPVFLKILGRSPRSVREAAYLEFA